MGHRRLNNQFKKCCTSSMGGARVEDPDRDPQLFFYWTKGAILFEQI
ncbi:hypothetical protein [Heyndrickxia oleronia]|nr:hypothetical protein [Heyndrickxia oleronia]MBU5214043.1 hypothetical protein [Heyndrickxia oleronia]